MQENDNTCIKGVGGCLECPFCKGFNVIRYGKTSQSKQRYKCKLCHKFFINTYTKLAYMACINDKIKRLLNEGCGIRSISKLLHITTRTVIRKILDISGKVNKPSMYIGKEYEVDEMLTYVGSKRKLYWIVYALEKKTRQVVEFTIGSRTNKTLHEITDKLLLSSASKVYTDKLLNYKYLIPSAIHSTKYRGTNYIERNHLTIRTHLKRLNRRSICYSKSAVLLSACLRIYFWSD